MNLESYGDFGNNFDFSRVEREFTVHGDPGFHSPGLDNHAYASARVIGVEHGPGKANHHLRLVRMTDALLGAANSELFSEVPFSLSPNSQARLRRISAQIHVMQAAGEDTDKYLMRWLRPLEQWYPGFEDMYSYSDPHDPENRIPLHTGDDLLAIYTGATPYLTIKDQSADENDIWPYERGFPFRLYAESGIGEGRALVSTNDTYLPDGALNNLHDNAERLGLSAAVEVSKKVYNKGYTTTAVMLQDLLVNRKYDPRWIYHFAKVQAVPTNIVDVPNQIATFMTDLNMLMPGIHHGVDLHSKKCMQDLGSAIRSTAGDGTLSNQKYYDTTKFLKLAYLTAANHATAMVWKLDPEGMTGLRDEN